MYGHAFGLSEICLDLLRNYSAKLFAEFVDLFEHLLCECCVECLLVSLWVVGLALEVVVEVYSLVDYLGNLVNVLIWVECYEKCAIVNELANEELDVFLENSKIHNFCV